MVVAGSCASATSRMTISRSVTMPQTWLGSDIHVMLTLCHSSRQVVMADEQLDGTDMMGELLGKDNASRISRDTRCLNVLLNRSR